MWLYAYVSCLPNGMELSLLKQQFNCNQKFNYIHLYNQTAIVTMVASFFPICAHVFLYLHVSLLQHRCTSDTHS